MIRVSCFKCKWKFTVDEGLIAEIVAQEGRNARHYAAECPRCGQRIKVALKSLRHNRVFQEALAAAREAAPKATAEEPPGQATNAAEESARRKEGKPPEKTAEG